jgi:uncharacterized protein (TIGR02996 family)
MTPEEAFLDDIREHPDDDGPRLIFADWLEDHDQGDRATFIRVQIERTRCGEDTVVLRQQAEQLLQANWDEWARPLAALVGAEPGEGWLRGAYHPAAVDRFRRGFVSFLDMHARRFLSHAAELFRLMPIRNLRLRRAGEVPFALARCPELRWLEGLEFIDYYTSPVDGTAMAHLADSPHLARLRYLGLYNNNLGDEGALHLARAGWLVDVQVLELGDNGLSHRGISALSGTAHAFRPVRLRLGGNDPGLAGLRALINSPVPGRLASLALDSCQLGPSAARVLAGATSFSALRSLDLDHNPLGDEGAAHLARAPWRSRLASLSVRGCGIGVAGEALLDE